MDKNACENTDKEIWRKTESDYYSPSIHVTESGSIGINVGDYVIVAPVEEWHEAMRLIGSTEIRLGAKVLPKNSVESRDKKKEGWGMEIHIVVHSRSHPIKAFLNKKKAMESYKRLKQDWDDLWGDTVEPPGSYGVISLKIDDGNEEEVRDGYSKRTKRGGEQIRLCGQCEYRKLRPLVPNKGEEGWCYMFPGMVSRCAQFKWINQRR